MQRSGGGARHRCAPRPCLPRARRAARAQERRERHRQNYMHITIHTSQTWADTFISELNDTHVEAELRTKHIPPQARPCGARPGPACFLSAAAACSLRSAAPCIGRSAGRSRRALAARPCVPPGAAPGAFCPRPPAPDGRRRGPQLDIGAVVRACRGARRRLLVLGYNATLTTAVEAPRQPKRHFDQIKARRCRSRARCLPVRLSRPCTAAAQCPGCVRQTKGSLVPCGERRRAAGRSAPAPDARRDMRAQALTRVNPAVYECVAALAADPASAVVIFSGSDKARARARCRDLIL